MRFVVVLGNRGLQGTWIRTHPLYWRTQVPRFLLIGKMVVMVVVVVATPAVWVR